MHNKPNSLFTENLKNLKAAIRAADHKLREQILLLLHDNKGMTVTDIFIKLRIDQCVASQHLAILRRQDLVTTQRKGKNIYYYINKGSIEELNELAETWSLGEIKSVVVSENSSIQQRPLLLPTV